MKDVVNELIEKIVAVDNGYWNTKVCTDGVQFFFNSKVERNNNPITSYESDIIKIGDVKYVVGAGADSFDIAKDKTLDEVHRICTYNALARITDPNKLTDYKLIIGLPFDQYINDKQRKKFIEYIKGTGTITVKAEDTRGRIADKMFNIIDVTVFPQCAGVLYSGDAEQYSDCTVGIIDIGGGTVQGCTFDKLNIVTDNAFSYDLGMHYLLNDIRKALNSRLNLSLQKYSMEYVLKNGVNGENRKKSLEIIKEFKVNHVKKIKDSLINNHWELETVKLLITGGGCIHLAEELKQAFPEAEFTADPIADNVKGFYNVGVAFYEEDN